MTYADFFAEVKQQFMEADVSDIQEHLAYQFNITGEAAGIFYVEVKEGKLYVEPYEYYDRDVIFTCSAKTLKKKFCTPPKPFICCFLPTGAETAGVFRSILNRFHSSFRKKSNSVFWM